MPRGIIRPIATAALFLASAALYELAEFGALATTSDSANPTVAANACPVISSVASAVAVANVHRSVVA